MAESHKVPAYMASHTPPQVVDKQRILREKTLIKRIRELHVEYDCEVSLDIVYQGDPRGAAAHHIVYKSGEHIGPEDVTWESLSRVDHTSPMPAMPSNNSDRFPQLLPVPVGEYAELGNQAHPTPPSHLPGWGWMKQGPTQMDPPCGPKALFPACQHRGPRAQAPAQPWDPSNTLPQMIGYKRASPGGFAVYTPTENLSPDISPYAFSVASSTSGQQPVYIDLSQKLRPIVTHPSEWWSSWGYQGNKETLVGVRLLDIASLRSSLAHDGPFI
ncbi:hypothetical protein M406DRAFT_326958 [Cryphonectria parasitica EP155]|uniref:Uncharacterized protein n=1 Tax=Cryphonectria parasitica (strain ATCC 38755 / EP155) TaxID=660469 RepID=A0A9P4Y852_CRYP1|nr:uncharacterized protein M406DRAFT_326958 [Cryphonectria parasitica EP155]KAF3768523.1 hypothetical protein M406DRAFT_326958 [Cryphonectria parasitica EP155]